MSRYLIIDTSTIKNERGFDSVMTDLEFYVDVLSEEETLSKFKEVWNAGYSKFEDYAFSSGDNQPDWENFSKTL